MTSKTQPMDQGVIFSLKTHYCNIVLDLQLPAFDKGRVVIISVFDALCFLRYA